LSLAVKVGTCSRSGEWLGHSHRYGRLAGRRAADQSALCTTDCKQWLISTWGKVIWGPVEIASRYREFNNYKPVGCGAMTDTPTTRWARLKQLGCGLVLTSTVHIKACAAV
jgi:hypothetical protein